MVKESYAPGGALLLQECVTDTLRGTICTAEYFGVSGRGIDEIRLFFEASELRGIIGRCAFSFHVQTQRSLMADIRLSVQIDVPPAQVYPLISSGSGFSKWWAEDMTEQPGGVIDLGFFKRAMVYSVRLVKTAAPSHTEWACLNGKEWEGTKLLFDLSETKGQTLLRFTHANWEKDTDYFFSCSASWGALIFRIKAAAEGRPRGPLFSSEGWSL